MNQESSSAYHREKLLQRAVVDLIRVGSRGHGAGVQQLARRLIRSAPDYTSDPANFREEIHKALASGVVASTGLRFTNGEMPIDDESADSLVDVDLVPTADGFVLDKATMRQLEEILAERASAEKLAQAGVNLTRAILLEGPPGVGKTMAAKWLADRLDLPLVSLDLATSLSSYLGSSGRNIRAVLDYAKSGPCVLLLDEFDAIAKRRDDDADIGELKRLVNVILIELDRWPDTGILIAATNHPQLIDPAAGRRFDRVITFALPDQELRLQLLSQLASGHKDLSPAVLDAVAACARGMSNSDLTRLWNLALRRSILNSSSVSDELVQEVLRTTRAGGPGRDRLFLALKESLNWPNRQIAALAGVTHPTVASALRRSRTERNAATPARHS